MTPPNNVSAEAWIALGALGVVVLGQIIGFTVWLTMLEMRTRANEKASVEFWTVRDSVRDMAGKLGGLCEDMDKLMKLFDVRPPGYEIAPGGRVPRSPPTD